MRLTKTVRLLAALVLAVGAVTSVQVAPAFAGESVLVAPAGLEGQIGMLESKLDSIEATGQGLGRGGTLSSADMKLSPDFEYAAGMNRGMTSALASAKLAVDSKGAKGEVASLKAFEDLAVSHESRLARLAEEADTLMSRIRMGDVVIEAREVASWSKADRAAFKAFLSPQAWGKYPTLAELTPAPGAAAPRAFAAVDLKSKVCSLAAPCVVPCYNKDWGACLSCIVRAGPAAVAAWSRFQSCWNGAGKSKWTPLWVWRIHCLADFVAKLA